MAYKDKEREKEMRRKWRLENKEKCYGYTKKWRGNNKERHEANLQKWEEDHKEERNKYKREKQYPKHKEKRRLQQKEWRKKYLLEWIVIIGKKFGKIECSKCGYKKHWSALQLHHNDPEQKKFNMGPFLRQKSTLERIEELDKCILLCANCHWEFHNNLDKDIEILIEEYK